MTKKPKWWVKHHEQNNKLRAMVGAQSGDGLKLLRKMKQNMPELYALYRDMSADQADALVSLYASNPLLRRLIEGEFSQKIPEENLEKNPKK